MALDIGPDTARAFRRYSTEARTVFWNGPMGVFETQPSRPAPSRSRRRSRPTGALTVVGGGDSASRHRAGRPRRQGLARVDRRRRLARVRPGKEASPAWRRSTMTRVHPMGPTARAAPSSAATGSCTRPIAESLTLATAVRNGGGPVRDVEVAVRAGVHRAPRRGASGSRRSGRWRRRTASGRSQGAFTGEVSALSSPTPAAGTSSSATRSGGSTSASSTRRSTSRQAPRWARPGPDRVRRRDAGGARGGRDLRARPRAARGRLAEMTTPTLDG